MVYEQRVILQHIYKHGEISLDKAMQLIGSKYYGSKRANTGKYLSAMVKRGQLARKKPGIFIAGPGTIKKQQSADKQQLNLFN